MENQKNKRIISYDILKIISMICVIMIHASSFYVVNSNADSLDFVLANILDSISRIAVPIFIMISGSLLLNEYKNLDIKKILKYIINTIFIIYIWSFIYSFGFQILYPIISHENINLNEFIISFIKGPGHFWYLFMLVGLYLITPILRLFVKKENSFYIRYLLVISVIINFIFPIINFIINNIFSSNDLFLKYVNLYKFNYISSFVTYYILGWYITNIDISNKKKIIIYVFGLISLITIILSVQFLKSSINDVYEVFYSNEHIFVLLYSLSFFMLIYNCTNKEYSLKTSNIIINVSKISFSVYVIHIMILSILQKFLILNIPGYLQIIFNWFITLLVSLGISWIISKIPYVKKLIRL